MAGKTSKASTQPPGEALSPKHEAFVQAYVSLGMNGTKAYRAVYPSIKSDDVAGDDRRRRQDQRRGGRRGCRSLADGERSAAREASRQARGAGLDRQAPRHVRRPRADTRAQADQR